MATDDQHPSADATDPEGAHTTRSAPAGTLTETHPVVNGLPLRLSFSADALREHFDDDEDWSVIVDQLSDGELQQVGAAALGDDDLYRVFHDSLVSALRQHLSS